MDRDNFTHIGSKDAVWRKEVPSQQVFFLSFGGHSAQKLLLFYLKSKIVRTCDFSHYLTTINLETLQRIYVTKFTCMWRILHFN